MNQLFSEKYIIKGEVQKMNEQMFELMRNDVKGNKELEDALEEAIKKDRYYTEAYEDGKLSEELLDMALTAVWKKYKDTVHRVLWGC